MKNLYYILFLFAGSLVFGQNVNFTDIEFKNILVNSVPTDSIAKNAAGNWVAIDANDDNEIQLSEALLIKYLDIPGNGFVTSAEGIKSFINADTIKVDYLDMIDALDVSNMPNLKLLSAQGNMFVTSFNVSGNTGLETLHVTGGDFPTLNLSGLTALKELYASGNGITSINFTGVTLLETLDVNNNALTTLNLQQFPALKSAQLAGNMGITTLNASGLLFLEELLCGFNSINNLNVQNTPLLELLEANENQLTSINLATSPQLTFLRLSDNLLSTLDVTANPLLEELYVSYNYLTLLDLHNNVNLTITEADTNELQTLIIKNGIVDEIYYDDNSNLTYICADDSEIAVITANNTAMGLTNCVVNSYCTFTPGGTFYTVSGETRFDADGNGCTSADPVQPLQKFTVNNGTVTNTVFGNAMGNYAVHVQQGSYTIAPVLETPAYFNVTPANVSVDFPTQTSPVNQNFCITANGNHNDLEVTVLPLTDSVPGYQATFKIVFKNKGTTTQSGAVTLNYNDDLMNFVNAVPAATSQSTGLLTWNFTNLAPFESDHAIVNFVLNTPTATPPLNNGDILAFNAQITAGTDATPADNSFILNETVVNSFDPNDKTCLEGSTISTAKVGDYVHYLIRFENTGTANAKNIVVKDIIDINKFDIASLVALSGSHSFVTRITSPNTVEFIFENIQLPFNNATNDGYVMFKIKTKSTLVLGDTFSNAANIYFDYNAPITTNTYTTTVQNILSTNEVTASADFVMYPNPVKDLVYFKTKENVQKIEIFDASGRIIRTMGVKNNSADLSELSNGNYLIKIYTKDKVGVQKLIKN